MPKALNVLSWRRAICLGA